MAPRDPRPAPKTAKKPKLPTSKKAKVAAAKARPEPATAVRTPPRAHGKASATASKTPAKAPAAGRTKASGAALAEELRRRLAEEGTVRLAGSRPSLPGAPSAAAVTKAAEAIAARGDALLFATTDGDALSRTWHALEEPAVKTLRGIVARADALFAGLPAGKKGREASRHLAREDVIALLAPVLDAFAPEADPRQLDARPILAAVDELAQVGPPDADAVSVPALVLFLTSSGAFRRPQEALAAVVLAAGLGHLELLPDGGLGLLADVDADLCPQGPHGTPLRWARRPGGAFTGREERRPTSLPPSRGIDAVAGLELERVDAWSAELFDHEDP